MSIIPRCPVCGEPLVRLDGELLCPDCTAYEVTPQGELEWVRWRIAELRAEERRLAAMVAGLPSQARPSQGV